MKIKVAAAALNTTPIGWEWNFASITAAIAEARAEGVQLLCLPELCLTGYGCEDLFFRPHVRAQALALAEQLARSSAGTDLVFTLGLPLEYHGAIFNTVAVVTNGSAASTPSRTSPATASTMNRAGSSPGRRAPWSTIRYPAAAARRWATPPSSSRSARRKPPSASRSAGTPGWRSALASGCGQGGRRHHPQPLRLPLRLQARRTPASAA
ncbi:MAG: hypothetical protein IPL39_20160 [Opitutaceae bacterium]|nr:hypothetical protein [Opitutaceae bacterium]